MTSAGTVACEAIRGHHRVLAEQLAARVSAVSAAAAAGQPHGAAVAGLIGYLSAEVFPHAAAEEATIYPAAAALDGLAGPVREMTAEHRTLSAAAGRLAESAGAAEAAERAQEIAGLFAGHVAKENDVLLPALLASHDTDVAALLADMHRRTEHAAGPEPADAAPAGDGSPETATGTGSPSGLAGGPALDIRRLPPARRHESIFAAWRDLAPGAGFVLVNDHDPKPLRYQFEAEHPGQFTWDYLEAGPRAWRVRIGRAPAQR